MNDGSTLNGMSRGRDYLEKIGESLKSNTMNDILPSHLSIQEINYYILNSMYKAWIWELKFVDQEFSFFSTLVAAEKSNTMDVSETAENISSLRQENQHMLDKVISHGNQLESLLECEDMACETFYLNDHQRFRKEVEEHIRKIRSFKVSLFRALK